MRKTFSFALIFLSIAWGLLLITNPSGSQRYLFPLDRSEDFTDYLRPRAYVDSPQDMYVDRTNIWSRGNASPMPALEILRPFAATCRGGLAFMIVSSLFFAGGVLLFLRRIGTRSFPLAILQAVSLMLSWVSLGAMNRGNCIFVAAALTLAFLSWFDSENPIKRFVAAMALGVATSIKISPVFFGVLYFFNPLRRGLGWKDFDWKNMVLSGAVASLLWVGPFLLGGSFVDDFTQWLSNVNREAVSHPSSWGLYGVMKTIGHVVPGVALGPCKLITLVGAAVLGFCFVVAAVRKDVSSRSDALFFLAATMLVACTNSMFYLGVMLFPSLLLWLSEMDGRGKVTCVEIVQLALWLLMLMPIQFVAFGKSMSLTITFVVFWLLISIKGVALCGKAYLNSSTHDDDTALHTAKTSA